MYRAEMGGPILHTSVACCVVFCAVLRNVLQRCSFLVRILERWLHNGIVAGWQSVVPDDGVLREVVHSSACYGNKAWAFN